MGKGGRKGRRPHHKREFVTHVFSRERRISELSEELEAFKQDLESSNNKVRAGDKLIELAIL